MKSVRMNLQIREDVKEWLVDESDKMGISQAALINICISQYRQQQQTLDIMNQLPNLFSKFEGIKNELEIGEK